MDCILLAAGKGERARLNYPKQLMRLGGKPILIRILELFESIDEIDRVIVTVLPGKINDFTDIIHRYNIKKHKVIEGGETRQKSVYKALLYAKSENVLIHEAARPFINKQFLMSIIMFAYDNIVPIVSVPFTLYNKNTNSYPNRSEIVNVQLPQKFNTRLLKEAHLYFKKENKLDFTDDSSLFVARHNDDHPILYTLGLDENIKITTPLDIKVAEALYEELSYCNWWK